MKRTRLRSSARGGRRAFRAAAGAGPATVSLQSRGGPAAMPPRRSVHRRWRADGGCVAAAAPGGARPARSRTRSAASASAARGGGLGAAPWCTRRAYPGTAGRGPRGRGARAVLHPCGADAGARRRASGELFRTEADCGAGLRVRALVRALGGRELSLPDGRPTRGRRCFMPRRRRLELSGDAPSTRGAVAADLGADRRQALQAVLRWCAAHSRTSNGSASRRLTGPIARGDAATVAGHVAWRCARGRRSCSRSASWPAKRAAAREKGGLGPDRRGNLRSGNRRRQSPRQMFRRRSVCTHGWSRTQRRPATWSRSTGTGTRRESPPDPRRALRESRRLGRGPWRGSVGGGGVLGRA
jgi:hypothetical protein